MHHQSQDTVRTLLLCNMETGGPKRVRLQEGPFLDKLI